MMFFAPTAGAKHTKALADVPAVEKFVSDLMSLVGKGDLRLVFRQIDRYILIESKQLQEKALQEQAEARKGRARARLERKAAREAKKAADAAAAED